MRIILCAIIFFSNSLFADSYVWFVGKIGNQTTTNVEVRRFVESTMLTDDLMISMFRQSKSFTDYLNKKESFIDERFAEGVKLYMNIKLLEYDAINDPMIQRTAENTSLLVGLTNEFFKAVRLDRWMGPKPELPAPPRLFFRLTKEQLEVQVQNRVERALNPWLSEGVSLDRAELEMAKKLRSEGYPHQSTDSDKDLFRHWRETLTQRVKEEYRLTEARQYVMGNILRQIPQYWVMPEAMLGFLNENAKLVHKDIDSKVFTIKSASQYLEKHPDRAAVISDVTELGLRGAPLFKIQSLNTAEYANLKDVITKDFAPLLGSELIIRIQDYEKSAHGLTRENSATKLQASMQQNWKIWTDQGSYPSLMKSKLFSMATTLKSGKVNVQSVLQVHERLFEKALASLQEALTRGDVYTSEEYQKLLFEDLVTKFLFESVNAELRAQPLKAQELEYFQKYLEMSVLVVRFEALKLAANRPGVLHVEFVNLKDKGSYQLLAKQVKKQTILQEFSELRTQKLTPKYEAVISINPNGKENISGKPALDFLFSGPSFLGGQK